MSAVTWVGSAAGAGFAAGTTIGLWCNTIALAPAIASVAQFVVLWPLLPSAAVLTIRDHAMLAAAMWLGGINGWCISRAVNTRSLVRFHKRNIAIVYTLANAACALVLSLVSIGCTVLGNWLSGALGSAAATALGIVLVLCVHGIALAYMQKRHARDAYLRSKVRVRRFVFVSAAFQLGELAVSFAFNAFDETPGLVVARFITMCAVVAGAATWAIVMYAVRTRRGQHVPRTWDPPLPARRPHPFATMFGTSVSASSSSSSEEGEDSDAGDIFGRNSASGSMYAGLR